MGCLRIFLVLAFLAVGSGSVVILVAIGGKSDGPGALLFYIGAFVGLGGAWTIATAGRTRE
jgi:hypothetical protein